MAEGFLDPKLRRDHIVPQVYLCGFIDPGRDQKHGPLEVFDLASYVWTQPRSPANLCAELGFYDYSVNIAPATADEAFRELEDGLSGVRESLRSNGFDGWTRHREFLLRFALMLVVRSRLFREQLIGDRRKSPSLRVLGVNGNSLRVEPIDWDKEPDGEALLKNLSITTMIREIDRKAEDWSSWNWVLRRAPSPECPFVTSDHPPVMDGSDPPDALIYRKGRFRIVIPFGWDFALVGGPNFDEPSSARYLAPEEMNEYRIVSASGARATLISPRKLVDMSWFGRVRPARPLPRGTSSAGKEG